MPRDWEIDRTIDELVARACGGSDFRLFNTRHGACVGRPYYRREPTERHQRVPNPSWFEGDALYSLTDYAAGRGFNIESIPGEPVRVRIFGVAGQRDGVGVDPHINKAICRAIIEDAGFAWPQPQD